MGVRHLLDTHVLLWLLSDHEKVPVSIRDRLADPGSELLVSAAAGLEIATKVRIGKLEAPDLVATLPGRVGRIGATTLAVSHDHALLAGSMPWPHRDPFDRILVAQATIENATLVTVDGALTGLPAPAILTW
ncbi:MAG TPA: type II toxin-antitoxin system VapC family toxin [Microlunatus sp.]